MEVCLEPVEAEAIQQVEIHDRIVRKRNLCFFFAALLNYFHWIEGAWGKVVVVAVSFCSPFEQIVKKLNFCSMRYYFAARFRWNNSGNYLWYSIEMTPQSENDTTRSRLINNMALPHIWLAQEISQTSSGATSHNTSSLKGWMSYENRHCSLTQTHPD